MTTQYTAFMAAYEALCREHKVFISAEAYDRLQVWDLEVSDLNHDTPFDMVDRTKERRCRACGYQHGHGIGCVNNPVDMKLKGTL